MFDVGWPELLVIAIVLIVVVGPKDLPRMLRTFGRTTAKMRSMAADFRKQFDEALKEAELEELKGLGDKARSLDPRQEVRKHLSPFEKAGQEIRSGLDAAMKPKPSQENRPAAAVETKAAEPAKVEAASAPAASDNVSALPEDKKPATAKKASSGNGGRKKEAGPRVKPTSSTKTRSATAVGAKKAAANGAKKTAGNGATKPSASVRKKAEKPTSRPKSSSSAKSPARSKASGIVS